MKVKKSISFLVLLVFAVSAFVSVQVFKPKKTEAFWDPIIHAIELYDCCIYYAYQCGSGDVLQMCLEDCIELDDCQKQIQDSER